MSEEGGSLACHTTLYNIGRKGGKRGLVNTSTASRSSARKPGMTNQIRDFEFIAK